MSSFGGGFYISSDLRELSFCGPCEPCFKYCCNFAGIKLFTNIGRGNFICHFYALTLHINKCTRQNISGLYVQNKDKKFIFLFFSKI